MAPDPARFAELICDYCLEVQPGQQVAVRSTTLAAPLLLALQEALLEREAWPLLRPSLPGTDEVFWRAARDRHLDSFPPGELAEAEGTDASVRIQAPENTRALVGVDAARMARAARARAKVREAALKRRWCLTLWPTSAGAQEAGMGTTEFAAFVERALFLDRDDPAARVAGAPRLPGAADRAPGRRPRAAHRGRGHRPDAERRGPHVGQLRRQAEHALGRGLHRPARALRRGPHPVHDPVEPRRRRGRGHRARVPRGPRRGRAGGARARST